MGEADAAVAPPRRNAGLLRLARWVFAAAVLAFIAKVAADNADSLSDVHLQVRAGWLVAAVPLGLAAGLVLPLSWRHLVGAYGAVLSRADAVRVWCLSQAARYLPTGVAGFASRIVMAGREGVSRGVAAASLAAELALLAAWSGLIAAVFIPSSVVAWPLRLLLGAGSAAVLAGLPWLLALGGRLLPRVPALAPHLLDRRQTTEAVGLYGVNAALKSGRFVLVAIGVLHVTGHDVPLLVGAEALGVLAGLIGITPAGIGVREAVIAGALRHRFGFGDALALAAIVRAWDFVLELVWLAVALGLRHRSARVGAVTS